MNPLNIPLLYREDVSQTLKETIECLKIDPPFRNYPGNFRPNSEYGNRPVAYYHTNNYIASQNNYISNQNNNHAARDSKDDSNSNRVLAGVIFTVVGFVASYFVGKAFAEYTKSNFKLEKLANLTSFYSKALKEFHNKLGNGNSLNGKDILDADFENLKDGIKIAKEVVIAEKKSAYRDIALRVGFIAFSIIGIGGALVAAPAAMATGGVGVLTLLAVNLIKWGYETNLLSHKEIKLNNAIEKLENVKRSIENSAQSTRVFFSAGYGLSPQPSAPAEDVFQNEPGSYGWIHQPTLPQGF